MLFRSSHVGCIQYNQWRKMLENSVVGLLTRYQNITYVLHLMKMRSRAPMEDRLCPMFHTVNPSCFAENFLCEIPRILLKLPRCRKNDESFLKFFPHWDLFDVCSFFFFKKRKIFQKNLFFSFVVFPFPPSFFSF